MSFANILQTPDKVFVRIENQIFPAQFLGREKWEGGGVQIRTPADFGQMLVEVEAQNTRPETIVLYWRHTFEPQSLFLADHWERAYGDLAWLPLNPERISPWYILHFDGKLTHGYGVLTGTSSMAFWQTTEQGIFLWLDVRCGGTGVDLTGRVLTAATIVSRKGQENESSFQAAKMFCTMMCPNPRLPAERVYGGNNWYTDYGNTSRKGVLRQAETISQLAGDQKTRPFMLVDDGWQICHFEACAGGPWTAGNYLFPHFADLAGELKEKGVRPGLWFRPLITAEQFPDECLLPQNRFKSGLENSFTKTQYLDPSAPAVLEKITEDIRRFTDWGFELIKHDFSTYDILGRWGFQMGGILTNSGWSFYNRSKTTAEIIREFYLALRDAAGDAYLMGCNTVSHLSAGIFELNRTGDDTSGREWERTRKMGVNTLAFRLPQHNTFYASDPDCIGLTRKVAWDLNYQFMELTARSGSPLFLSIELESFHEKQAEFVHRIFAESQVIPEEAEPLDWMQNRFPTHWKFDRQKQIFNWYPQLHVDVQSEVFHSI